MAIISSASSRQGTIARADTARKPAISVRAAQDLAKLKAVEKKAKRYKLPLGELAIFTQQLASLLVAGLPLVQCLEALQDQTEDPCFRVIIRDVRADISSGNSFSSAVRKFPRAFNNLFVSMVEAGEASGGLAEILGKVAGYFESTVRLTKKVKSAMTYPIAVIGLAIALVNVLLIFVIPVFAAMFADFGAKLPAPTQFLIDLSNFLKSLVVGDQHRARRRVLAGREVRVHARGAETQGPVFGEGADLRKPDPQDRALPLLPHVRDADPFGRADPAHARDRRRRQRQGADRGGLPGDHQHVSQGGQVSEVLATNPFFPPMMKHMVRAGEATGNVDGMMTKISDFYDVECEATIAALTSLIEPLLIVVLGVIIGGIVMAMFLPIFQLGAVAGGL